MSNHTITTTLSRLIMLGIPDALYLRTQVRNPRARSCPPETGSYAETRPQPKRLLWPFIGQLPAQQPAASKSPKQTNRHRSKPAPTVLDTPDTLLTKTRHRRAQSLVSPDQLRTKRPMIDRRQWRYTRVELAASMPPTFTEPLPSYVDATHYSLSRGNRMSRSTITEPRDDELFLEPNIGKTPRYIRRRTIQIYPDDGHYMSYQNAQIPRQITISESASSQTLEDYPEATPVDASNLFGWGAWQNNYARQLFSSF